MSEQSHAADAGHDEAHENHTADYIVVFGYLCMLTLSSFVSNFVNAHSDFWSPTTNGLFVLAVGVIKASFVVGIFMHLKYEKAWKYFLTIPPCILGVVIVLVLAPDVAFETYPRTTWHGPTAITGGH